MPRMSATSLFSLAARGVIEIVGAEFDREPVGFHQQIGVGEEKIGVRFEVDESIVGQKAAIAFEKMGGGESFGHLLHLRIGEREPNFSDFSGRKKLVDEFDVRTEKSHVVHALVVGFCCPAPHACAFDIHPNKIFCRGRVRRVPRSIRLVRSRVRARWGARF